MSKVWVVFWCDWETRAVDKVFATEEAARNYIGYKPLQLQSHYEIDEWDVIHVVSER